MVPAQEAAAVGWAERGWPARLEGNTWRSEKHRGKRHSGTGGGREGHHAQIADSVQ
ncbi:hypothetical protein FIBSPDRAFT_373244 [Athelia psychrophila]|uniref:Uncharacterized protein n=1 Tax=Athelia psychrophila TaxID=1759441 RepID=A0A166VX12_9AGAM|nr:hypothetical protein FIBSPDRAFT_373244 [Fibularhizoctonia sp. CBS 109695]